MKGCELCGNPARMYCESDDASLCWGCDNKVHSANFLVAKHHRTLLCRTCQSPTPWKASGSNLGPTVSVCDSCFSSHCNVQEPQEEQESHSEEEEEEESVEDEEESVYDDYDDVEDGENQVVPWSEMVPPGTSSWSSDEEITSGSKRMRDNKADLDSDDEMGCSSSQQGSGRCMNNEEGTSYSSYNENSNDNNKPLKRQRRGEDDHDEEEEEEDNHGEEVSKSNSSPASIIDSFKRLQRDMVSDGQSASAALLDICKLSRDQSL